MTFANGIDFINSMYAAYGRNNEGQRIGQFAYNYFRRHFLVPFPIPESVNCFYDDALLDKFLTWVVTNWNVLEE